MEDMNEKLGTKKEFINNDTMELSMDKLDQVQGGIITQKGIEWMTRKIHEGKAAGVPRENVAFLARYSCGKGALAQTTGDEAENWVLKNWDLV